MIVLDTHALVFHLAAPEDLSARARRRIEKETAAGTAYVSSMSLWEVAMLAARGRLRLTVPVEDWAARAQAVPGLVFVPVDNAIALRAVALPGEFPADPADRIIAATAILLGADLVTRDRRLRGIEQLSTFW